MRKFITLSLAVAAPSCASPDLNARTVFLPPARQRGESDGEKVPKADEGDVPVAGPAPA